MRIVSQKTEPAPGVLYIVGTPIGHLGDFSPRAKSLLHEVSVIACEDTRHSGKLLSSINAKGSRISFHQHNAQTRIPKLLDYLKNGKSIALISDAGLPGISDPGEELVAAAHNQQFKVICIPGPCAAITALVSSGLPSQKFCFEGFLPTKAKKRKERLIEIAEEKRTSLIYEAPHRLLKLLHELEEVCGGSRQIKVARELTKVHEEQLGDNISSVLEHFLANKPQGEFTIVLEGKPDLSPPEKTDDFWKSQLEKLISAGETPSEAVRKLAKETGHSKRKLYELVHNKEKR